MAWSIVLTSMAQTCTNQPRNERFKYDTLPHSTTTKLASNRRPRSSISNPEVGGSSPTHCQGRLELPGCVGAGFCPRACNGPSSGQVCAPSLALSVMWAGCSASKGSHRNIDCLWGQRRAAIGWPLRMRRACSLCSHDPSHTRQSYWFLCTDGLS